jgi:hypothetical protein
MFRLAKPTSVKITCLYLNNKNQCVGKTNANNIDLSTLIYFIGVNNSYDHKMYTVQDIFKYTVMVKNPSLSYNPETFITTGKSCLQREEEESVVFFHDLNEIILLFKEKPRHKRSSTVTKKNIKQINNKSNKRRI